MKKIKYCTFDIFRHSVTIMNMHMPWRYKVLYTVFPMSWQEFKKDQVTQTKDIQTVFFLSEKMENLFRISEEMYVKVLLITIGFGSGHTLPLDHSRVKGHILKFKGNKRDGCFLFVLKMRQSCCNFYILHCWNLTILDKIYRH